MRTGKLIATVLLLVACTACASRRKEVRPVPTGQTIVFSDALLRSGGTDTVRFGSMRSGEIAVKPLVLHNASRHPVLITDCTRSCGCTTLEFDNQPFKPDERRSARMIFDARGLAGWQFKLLEMRFAGSEKPLKIFIEAEVE